jgi:hypothetical protein
MQNTSHAVMAQRTESKNSLDDFPTPPWATRALIEHVLAEHKPALSNLTCLEPACGAGHMAKVLKEYFREVRASDVHDYGYGSVRDFLDPYEANAWDWVITNPPFRLGEQFVLRSLNVARQGVAILAQLPVGVEEANDPLRLLERLNQSVQQNPIEVMPPNAVLVVFVEGVHGRPPAGFQHQQNRAA